MLRFLVFLREFALLALLLLSGFVMTCMAVSIYLTPTLPAVEALQDYRLSQPLRIFAADGELLAEYGNERRDPVNFEQMPAQFVQALTAVEDSRFEEHFGMDPVGFSRAALGYLTGNYVGGGSTLTQQVARNYFLNREQTFTRKFTEILLALQMEQQLSKAEIFELYANKHFLGHRAYGIAAAAKVYYNRDLGDLTLAELAMIAGMHQAPSAANPFTNESRALKRRNHVLDRMLAVGHISPAAHATAKSAPITATRARATTQYEAPYVAEMVRLDLIDRYGEEQVYANGYNVFTSIHANKQTAANEALRQGLIDYYERHGYRGPEAQLEQVTDISIVEQALDNSPIAEDLEAAVVMAVSEESFAARLRSGEQVLVEMPGWKWAKPFISENRVGAEPELASDVVAVGDLIRLRQTDAGWKVAQLPTAEGAFVAIDPNNGGILALAGGYDYAYSQFNRVTQTTRQPGSTVKPFIYSAALAEGLSAGSIINDAPVIYSDDQLETTWRPKNSGNSYLGPIPMRQALYQSRNASSVRVLEQTGISNAVNYMENFGFEPEEFAKDLSLVLGTNAMTPLEVVRGYAVFANGGYLVEPWFIDRIEDRSGNIVFQHQPSEVCQRCQQQVFSEQPIAPQAIDPRIAYIMDSILKDTVQKGTARRATVLERNDLAGKTGTTNDGVDAWFTGYHPDIVASVYVGFDEAESLGSSEFGSKTALPVWVDFMRTALENVPVKDLTQPSGLVRRHINKVSGDLTTRSDKDGYDEWFREEYAPTQTRQVTQPSGSDDVLPVFGETPIESTPAPDAALDNTSDPMSLF